MKAVAIVIVTYNSAEQIGVCLRSVIEQREAVDQEIIVVDNCSRDNTVDLIRRDFPEVKLICSERNLGFAAGVNEASRHAQSRYLLLLNPDTEVLDHAIDRAVEFAEASPTPVLVGGRGVNHDGSLEPTSCWELPSLWSMATFASGLSTAFAKHPFFDPESIGGWQRDTIREVGFVTGCFLLVPTTLWRELGGFDERFFMYGEDADLAMRARRRGARVMIVPQARFRHEGGKSSETPVAKMVLLFRGKSTYLRMHWRGFQKEAGLFFLNAGVLLRGLLSQIPSRTNKARGTERWKQLWDRRSEWQEGYPV